MAGVASAAMRVDSCGIALSALLIGRELGVIGEHGGAGGALAGGNAGDYDSHDEDAESKNEEDSNNHGSGCVEVETPGEEGYQDGSLTSWQACVTQRNRARAKYN